MCVQDEVERGWQVAHQHTVERDKAVAEKESLDYTSSIAINTARREVRTTYYFLSFFFFFYLMNFRSCGIFEILFVHPTVLI